MAAGTRWWSRARRRLRPARQAEQHPRRGRSPAGRLATALGCLLAGLLVTVSALNARGTDLRPGRNLDLISLVQAQSRHNSALARQVTDLREDVDDLAQEQQAGAVPPALARQAEAAGLTAVQGPALTVTLDDAPASADPAGIDADLLVVHQQDIQAVVNALWSGGAEALTIQGQRVISTTGVKCVGNTVVLHGIPYAPPYVVSALGDQRRLRSALAGSRSVTIYKQYADAYGLTYDERATSRATFPGHQGSLDLKQAEPVTSGRSPEATRTR